MADVTLLLGPVVFQDFEVPSGVNFGGRQRLVMHRLPGGSRVIDALGRDDAQISFSGIFSGSDATLRARSLDQLRVAGIALPLTWDVLFYTVLISEFQASYRSSWWIPYRIVCTVLRDEASELIQFAASLATTALADIGTASGTQWMSGWICRRCKQHLLRQAPPPAERLPTRPHKTVSSARTLRSAHPYWQLTEHSWMRPSRVPVPRKRAWQVCLPPPTPLANSVR